MSVLSVDGVTFRYGSTAVLSDVTFDVRAGELVGILGPNGCGKTTLMRVMAGYLRPEAGVVSYDGRAVNALRPRDLARLRAVVEQRLTSPFEFSVYDYVLMGRTPYLGRFQAETLEDHRIAEEALELARAVHLHDRSIGELSGGELQRVMIARALAQEPEFLLLDEPTAHLDIKHQLEIMHLLKNLSRDICVVTVIHDVNHAISFCDRTVLLRDGTVAGCGDPTSVLSTPAIREVFGVDSYRLQHPHLPQAQLAFSIPLPRHRERKSRILVIGGGGCAQAVLFALVHAGYIVRAGVLHEGDRDLDVARALGCDTLTAPPFSRIGSADAERLQEWCRQSDAIAVAAMPVGEGNLANLEVACSMIGDRPIVLFSRQSDFRELDHTGGRAEQLFAALEERSSVAATVDELLRRLVDLIGSGSAQR